MLDRVRLTHEHFLERLHVRRGLRERDAFELHFDLRFDLRFDVRLGLTHLDLRRVLLRLECVLRRDVERELHLRCLYKLRRLMKSSCERNLCRLHLPSLRLHTSR